MDLSAVAVFVESVRAGSLAGAARRLGISSVVASRRLAALEAELGIRLIHRTTRALSPTTEGEAALPHMQALLDDAAAVESAIRPGATGASGLLRVTASIPFGRKVVTPMAAAFLRAHPDLRLDLMLTDDVVDIVALGIDLAIRIAPLRENNLIAQKLADSPRALHAAPAYLAARGTPRILADLRNHACLATTETTHWAFTHGNDRITQRVSPQMTSNSVDALIAGCIAGMGIANVSVWNTQPEVESGALVPIALEDGVPETLGIWAVHPSSQWVAPKVRLFVAALREHLRGG